MALLSAFFVSAQELDMEDLKFPNFRGKKIASMIEGPREPLTDTNNDGVYYLYERVGRNFREACSEVAALLKDMDHGVSPESWGSKQMDFIEWQSDLPCMVEPPAGSSYTNVTKFNAGFCLQSQGGQCNRWYKQTRELKISYGGETQGEPECPPDNEPAHKFKVTWAGETMCARELDDPKNCPEFGDKQYISLGENTSATVCYTDKGGTACSYSFDDVTKSYKADGKVCDGTEDDYEGDPTKPDPDKCISSTISDLDGNESNVAMCPINPDEHCSNVSVDGEYYSVCPDGCGQIEGRFFCSGLDSDEDGVPDVIDDDPLTPNPNPDPNPDPDGTNVSYLENLTSNINNKATQRNNLLKSMNDKLGAIARSPGITGTGGTDGDGSEIKIDLNKVNQNTLDTAEGVADLNKALTEEPDQSISEFEPTDQGTSWWTRDYENGVKGVWEEKYPEIQQTELFTFLNTLAVSGGGSAPDMSIDFSALGLGQGSFNIDPRVYSFLSIFFLVCTGFACRKIIFGG